MSEIAVSVSHITKIYKIFSNPMDRVKEALNPFGKRYSNDFYALNDVSFDIKRGETLGIIGKNGAGKSTLLKILTGVLTPTSGNIVTNGKIASLLELGAGFNPDMTGLENIYLNGSIMGYTREEMDKRVPAIVEFADIGDFIHQPVKMYSSGMFARLAFSVNINVEPEILIVDEALSVGDEFFQQKCIYRMKEMQKSGVTVLFVSHSIAAVKSLCDRCIMLEHGIKKHDGKANVVCDIYQNLTTGNNGIRKDKNLDTSINFNNNSVDSLFRIDSAFNTKCSERSGTMEIEITAFDVYKEDKIVGNMPIGTPLRIVVSGIANADIPYEAPLGILCRDILGNDVFIGNLNLFDIYLPKFKKGDRFCADITYDVPLAPGKYFFGGGVKPFVEGDYFYDRIFNCASVEVYQEDFSKGIIGGVVCAKLCKSDIKVL